MQPSTNISESTHLSTTPIIDKIPSLFNLCAQYLIKNTHILEHFQSPIPLPCYDNVVEYCCDYQPQSNANIVSALNRFLTKNNNNSKISAPRHINYSWRANNDSILGEWFLYT